MTNHYLIAALTVAMCIPSTSLLAQPIEPKQALQNLNELPNQFTVPITSEGTPAPGKRVWQRIESYQGSSIAYALYLPTDWQAGKKYPVIFEFPGNGAFAMSWATPATAPWMDVDWDMVFRKAKKRFGCACPLWIARKVSMRCTGGAMQTQQQVIA